MQISRFGYQRWKNYNEFRLELMMPETFLYQSGTRRPKNKKGNSKNVEERGHFMLSNVSKGQSVLGVSSASAFDGSGLAVASELLLSINFASYSCSSLLYLSLSFNPLF